MIFVVIDPNELKAINKFADTRETSDANSLAMSNDETLLYCYAGGKFYVFNINSFKKF